MNSLIIAKLSFSQQEHVQIFQLPSPSKTCALPFNFALDRKISSIICVTRRIVRTRPSIFCHSIDMNIYKSTWNLPVCNSGQHTCYGFNLFFVLQDLIDRIDSYFQKIAFQRTCFLLASSSQRHKFFSM